MIQQPNGWSCNLYAFAMAMDEKPEHLQGLIGHDGSEIIVPGLGDAGRIGFTIAEMITAAVMCGYAVTPLIGDCNIEFSVEVKRCPLGPALPGTQVVNRVVPGHVHWKRAVLVHYRAVIIVPGKHGGMHAVAWCPESRMIFNPTGLSYGLCNEHESEDVFLVTPIANRKI